MNTQEFIAQYNNTHIHIDMNDLEAILVQKIHDPDLMQYMHNIQTMQMQESDPYKDAHTPKYAVRSKIYEANPLIIQDVLEEYYTSDRIIQTLASVEQKVLGEDSAITLKLEEDTEYIQTMRNLYIQDIMRALQTQNNSVSLKVYVDAAGKQLAHNLLAYDTKN